MMPKFCAGNWRDYYICLLFKQFAIAAYIFFVQILGKAKALLALDDEFLNEAIGLSN